MDAELKQQWISDLRDGRFKQTTHTLSRKDKFTGAESFCCLGVLHYHSGPKIYGARWKDSLESVLTTDQRLALIDLNDRQGKTFNEIADYIEENLKCI